jgi:hypothetical protein
MIKGVLVLGLAFSMMGCRSVSANQQVSDLESKSKPSSKLESVYTKNGQSFVCTPRSLTARCPRIAVKPDLEFQDQCTKAGGVLKACGACGFELGCTVPTVQTETEYLNEKGEIVECPSRSLTARCTREVTRPADELVTSCQITFGGNIVSCGACGKSYACKVVKSVGEGTVIDAKGKEITCPPRDPDSNCPTVMVAAGIDLINMCADKDGEVISCGSCGLTFGCKVKK